MSGRLVAEGTEAAPITFTAHSNDASERFIGVVKGRKVFISFSDYMKGFIAERADVAISMDGTSWTRKHGWSGGSYPVSPRTTILNLTNELANATSFKVRFHYYNASNAYYWAIDNVRVFCEDPSLGIENYLLYLPMVLQMQ